MRFARLLFLAALAALIVVPAAMALRFTDASFFTPTGSVGQPYSHQFAGAGGCGPDGSNAGLPYQFRILSGGLPPGLTLSKAGLVSGIPTTPGSYSFYVELSDEDPPSADWCRPAKAERDFTIVIQPGLVIQQAQASVPPATVGVAYGPVQFTASGGGTQSWSATGLPPGMTFSATGVLAGTPTTKGGDYRISLRVQDTSGRFNVLTYALPVRDPLAVTSQTVPPAEVGRPFTVGFAATGGSEVYTWETAALPDGLTFDAAKHAIVGVPTVPGTFAAKVTVKDTEGRATTSNVNIVVAPKLAVATRTPLKPGKVGKRYAVTFKAAGGVGAKTWKLVRFRPGAVAVTFDRTTGTLRFLPGRPRTYTIVVRVTDALKAISTKTVTLKINA